jgi:molybdopterin/thiamine biosynthesis adenylyltransferase
MTHDPVQLNDEDRERYAWQLTVPGFDEDAQALLKGTSVLVSRCGGLGSVVAYELAAAGVGKLVLAHAGALKVGDLNRQLLMTDDWIGKPRVECAARRLKELNPTTEVVAIAENVSEDNAEALVSQADLVVDCAPMFEERLAMNDACVKQGKPMVECAMYELQATITSIVPGKTPCLRCLVPEPPSAWKREFPVFGAVSGTIGCIAAMEAIKLRTGLGEPLLGRMLSIDLRSVAFEMTRISRRDDCRACGSGS